MITAGELVTEAKAALGPRGAVIRKLGADGGS